MLDAAYAVLVRALFAQLERVAGPDAKHGDRLRLENYALLEAQLRPLAARVGAPACAQDFLQALRPHVPADGTGTGETGRFFALARSGQVVLHCTAAADTCDAP